MREENLVGLLKSLNDLEKQILCTLMEVMIKEKKAE